MKSDIKDLQVNAGKIWEKSEVGSVNVMNVGDDQTQYKPRYRNADEGRNGDVERNEFRKERAKLRIRSESSVSKLETCWTSSLIR